MRIYTFILFLILISLSNLNAQESLKNTEPDTLMPKYEFGYSIGWTSICMSEFTTNSKYSQPNNLTAEGQMVDYLTEINVSGKYFLTNGIGLGLTLGRHSYYEKIGNNYIGQSIFGKLSNVDGSSSSEQWGVYIAGLKISPSVSYKNLEFGYEIFFPSISTATYNKYGFPFGNQSRYFDDDIESFNKKLEPTLQNSSSLFLRFDFFDNKPATALGFYVKLNYDLQTPFGNANTYYDVTHTRYTAMLGLSYKFKFY